MSLFIGGLAFAETGVGYNRIDRFAIILASVVCAIVGDLILYFGSKPQAAEDNASPTNNH